MAYQPKNPIRIVTAASLFDGHDASINLIRRLLQDAGAEVIHLGHNRSVLDVVTAALQEGAQGVCMSSYQGGHVEYFKYMKDLLREAGADYVKIYGGGGGVIVHEEKKMLEDYGIDFIFHPDDGRKMGLEGMIDIIIKGCDYPLQQEASQFFDGSGSLPGREDMPHKLLGVLLDQIDIKQSNKDLSKDLLQSLKAFQGEKQPLVLGVTGTGGAGKSSLVDELIQRFLNAYKDIKIGVICVDPSKRKTGGALLGDRIRMNSLSRKGVFMRSVASRGSGNEIAGSLPLMLETMKNYQFDLIIAETSGIGQANVAITEFSDLSLYVMTSEFGAQSQLEKIDMIDYADLIAINKADHRGSQDALRDVRKQYKRSHKCFEAEDHSLPVFLTQAAQFNDLGANQLFFKLTDILKEKDPSHGWGLAGETRENLRGVEKQTIIPPERQSYLAEIVASVRDYKKETEEVANKASRLGSY
ncbi:MAG: cobalamin-dependent protein, partial [Bdellovibrionales bacterium]|nr:cobalamin-dependent protein [Bdellovibrionales bacterium]